jgi:hypothetical protein
MSFEQTSGLPEVLGIKEFDHELIIIFGKK